MNKKQTLDFRYPKDCRIRKRFIYQLLFRKGRRIALPHFVIYYATSDTNSSRLGLTVSRKVGNAVVRNRCKRHLKEFFRCHRHQMNTALDLSILVRPGVTQLTSLQIHKELMDALVSASLVKLP